MKRLLFAGCLVLGLFCSAQAKPYIEAWDFDEPPFVRQVGQQSDGPRITRILMNVVDKNVTNHQLTGWSGRKEFLYDDEGRLIEERVLGSDDKPTTWWVIEYDDKGRRKKITEHARAHPQFYEEATYDKKGRWERIVRRRATGNEGEMGEVTFEYARGRTVQFAVKGNMDDGNPMRPLILKFDRMGRLEERTLLNPSLKPTERFIFQFDKKTKRIAEAKLLGGSRGGGNLEQVAKHVYSWEEDEHGNWTKREIERYYASALERGKLILVSKQTVTREIKYEGEKQSKDEPKALPDSK